MGNQSDLGKAHRLNLNMGNLEAELLAGEGGWIANRPFVSDKVKWMGQSMPMFPIIYTHLHIINLSSGVIFTIQMECESFIFARRWAGRVKKCEKHGKFSSRYWEEKLTLHNKHTMHIRHVYDSHKLCAACYCCYIIELRLSYCQFLWENRIM